MILHEVPFWAITVLMAGFAINNGYFAGRVGGTDVWPVTYLMVQAVEGSATLFFYIVAALYAAELLWRERDVHFEGIHDSLPIGESIDWLSRFVAIAFVELILLTITMICGIAMQTLAGYYHYELLQYFKELYSDHVSANSGAGVVCIFCADRRGKQIRRTRNHYRDHHSGSDSVQLRLGEHAVPLPRCAAVHLQRHERLRPFRSGAVLVDHLLVGDFGISWRDLDRAGAARSR